MLMLILSVSLLILIHPVAKGSRTGEDGEDKTDYDEDTEDIQNYDDENESIKNYDDNNDDENNDYDNNDDENDDDENDDDDDNDDDNNDEDNNDDEIYDDKDKDNPDEHHGHKDKDNPIPIKMRSVCGEVMDKCGKISDPKQTIVFDSFSNQTCRSGKNSLRSKARSHFRSGAERLNPHLALIGYCGGEMMHCDVLLATWDCSGSLISPKYILSAAHCATPINLGPASWARLGSLDTSVDSEKVKDVQISEIFVYPKFRRGKIYHDIALFRMKKNVSFNSCILPVCLHSQFEFSEGRVNFNGEKRRSGKQDDQGGLKIYSQEECKKLMFKTPIKEAPRGLQYDKMFCAGVSDTKNYNCELDSGKPLVVGNIPGCNFKTQIGVSSFGNLCDPQKNPTIFTRVSYYVSWIEDIAFKHVTPCDDFIKKYNDNVLKMK